MRKILNLLFIGLAVIMIAGCSYSKVSTEVLESESSSAQELWFSIPKPKVPAVEPYIAMLDNIKNDQGFKVVESASNNVLYQKKIVISVRNIAGGVTKYTLYFNEEAINDKKVSMVGIMIADGVEYSFEGSNMTVVNKNKTETKLQVKAILDDNNYCLLGFDIDDKQTKLDTKFNYEVYQSDALVKAVNIKFENRDDETKVKLETINGSTTSEYELEQVGIDVKTKYVILEAGQIVSEDEDTLIVTVDPVYGITYLKYVVDDNDDKDNNKIEKI